MKETVTKDNFENISNKDKSNISFQSDNISLEKTLTSGQFETAGTSSLSDSNNWFDLSLKTNSSIILMWINYIRIKHWKIKLFILTTKILL